MANVANSNFQGPKDGFDRLRNRGAKCSFLRYPLRWFLEEKVAIYFSIHTSGIPVVLVSTRSDVNKGVLIMRDLQFWTTFNCAFGCTM